MKVSDITTDTVSGYLRLDEQEEQEQLLEAILEAAVSYVEGYTGLPRKNEDGDCIDRYEDLAIAVLVLCQDMYDNRSAYVERNYANRTVDTILGMHCRNLV